MDRTGSLGPLSLQFKRTTRLVANKVRAEQRVDSGFSAIIFRLAPYCLALFYRVETAATCFIKGQGCPILTCMKHFTVFCIQLPT